MVGDPCCDRKAEVVTPAPSSTCTGGDEKVARGSGVSCGGADGSNVSVGERGSAGAEKWRSQGSNRMTSENRSVETQKAAFSIAKVTGHHLSLNNSRTKPETLQLWQVASAN